MASQQNHSFSRVRAFIAAVSALIAKGESMQTALAAIGPYTSRGKGLGKYSGKKRGNRSGRVYAANGQRECARRVRQLASGQLSFFNQQ